MKEQRTLRPIQVGNTAIEPIVEVDIHASRHPCGLWVRGSLRPVAIRIRRADGPTTRIEVPSLERRSSGRPARSPSRAGTASGVGDRCRA